MTSLRSIYLLEEYTSRQNKEYIDEDTAQLEKEFIDQLNHEWETVNIMMEPCDYSVQVMNQIPNFCENKLVRLLRTEFFDENVMTRIQCIITALFKLRLDNISFQNWVRYWINNLYLLEANSEESTLLSYFGSIQNSFIIKIPRNYSSPYRTAHEIFVAYTSTNKLRQKIPNFAYVFTGFLCSKPLFPLPIGSERQPTSFCTSTSQKTNVSYVIYEKIQSYPGAPETTNLTRYITKCSATQFLNIYLQILYSLHMAYKSYGFTHYNLNTDKVEIRFLLSENTIAYETDNIANEEIEYLETDSIATITDYSFARVVYVNHSYGVSGHYQQGINPRQGHPLYDAYKLFMFSMYIAMSTNKEVFALGEKIYPLFNANNETLTAALKAQHSIYYSIYPLTTFPVTETKEWYTIFKGTTQLTALANAIRSITIPDFISKTKPFSGLLSCTTLGGCRSSEEDISKIIFCKSNKLTSSYQFTLRLELMQQNGQLEEIKTFVNHVKADIPDINNQETANLSNNISSLSSLMTNLTSDAFDTLSPNKQSIDLYAKNLGILSTIIQRFQECQFHYYTILKMDDVYGLTTIDPTQTFESIRIYISKWLEAFKTVYEITEKVPMTRNVENLPKIKNYSLLLTTPLSINS